MYICIYIYIYIYIYTYPEARRRWAYLSAPATPNLPTNIVDFRGFDTNIILI